MPPGAEQPITVEVAFATSDQQHLVTVEVAEGASVADAIAAARIEEPMPDAVDELAVGVWGKVVARDAALRDGDRVEIYRPLKLDPREARRRYAAAGMTMAEHSESGDDA